jgi:hypothetical protein
MDGNGTYHHVSYAKACNHVINPEENEDKTVFAEIFRIERTGNLDTRKNRQTLYEDVRNGQCRKVLYDRTTIQFFKCCDHNSIGEGSMT